MGPKPIESFDCWVCGTRGIGPADLSCHECNLSKFNFMFEVFLLTCEGQFLTYMARKMISNASSGSNNTLAI